MGGMQAVHQRGRGWLFLLALAIVLAVGSPAFGQEADWRRAREKALENEDTVGWLRLPGTAIDGPVVQDTGDANQFYLNRNFLKRYDSLGWIFADYRCTFIGQPCHNTVIYGQSISEDPQGERFAPLKRYRDEDFARENPLIYFSTLNAIYTYQVFAVSVVDYTVPYAVPEPDLPEWESTLARMREASLHPFAEVEVAPGDIILTLVTTDYSLDPAYPNPNRFVVMARLEAMGEDHGEIRSGGTANPDTGRV